MYAQDKKGVAQESLASFEKGIIPIPDLEKYQGINLNFCMDLIVRQLGSFGSYYIAKKAKNRPRIGRRS